MSRPSPLCLSTLKAWQLKYCAFLMGLDTTGSKTVIQGNVQQRFARQPPTAVNRRVVSVDMGIRNLAFCLLEVNIPKPANFGSELATTGLNVRSWKKIDLLKQLPFEIDESASDENGPLPGKRKKATPIPPSFFAPSNLTKIAYNVSDQLLSYKPDVILIERQRHRSGGASAILEWTVRVNMLESMLWACLHTIKQQRTGNPGEYSMYEVLPARVARFWTAAPRTSLRASDDSFEERKKSEAIATVAEPSRSKDVKKDKIDVVRSWLQGGQEVQLRMDDEVKSTADLFMTKRQSTSESLRKLDDLADCLLQGAAWVRWQENGRFLAEMLATTDSKYDLTTIDNAAPRR